MSWSIAAELLGGIGLFLLGMWLMTEGLRLAAGNALRRILARSTRTLTRGIVSGAAITAVVQSSSAVTVATIGFVNASLMTLKQAVAVIYGANIGTTMTGWIVAIVGFQLDIGVFALPVVGIGMLARIFGGERGVAAAGQALTGFGILFFGIDVLKSAFGHFSAGADLTALGGGDALSLLLSVGAGVVLTTLMQSSSAAMAIVLTAAGGGVVGLDIAAALVIGTNLGTTSTGLLAAIGATPNARRAAAAHVLFNAVAAVAALMLLPLLLALAAALQPWLGLGAGPAALLALFHTLFNILGTLLLVPFTPRLVAFLERRFRAREEDEMRPRYLDRNVVATPVLAADALTKELKRVGAVARRMTRDALASELRPARDFARHRAVIDALADAIGEFIARLQQAQLPAALVRVLPNALRVVRYYSEAAELADTISRAREYGEPLPEQLAAAVAGFGQEVANVAACADPDAVDFPPAGCDRELARLQLRYQELKNELLRADAEIVAVRRLVEALDELSNMRRLAEQLVKAARYVSDLARPNTQTAPGTQSSLAAAPESAVESN